MFSDVEWRNLGKWHIGFADESLRWFERALLVIGWTGVTSLLALISFHLPMTPVPFTLQMVGILGAGAYLRRSDAVASMLLYLLVGAMGAPVFSGGEAGLAYMLGPTIGYLIAFPVAALVVAQGFTIARRCEKRRWLFEWSAWLTALMVVYIGGMVGLMHTFSIPLSKAYEWGMEPFILWDCLKIGVVAMIVSKSWKYQ